MNLSSTVMVNLCDTIRNMWLYHPLHQACIPWNASMRAWNGVRYGDTVE